MKVLYKTITDDTQVYIGKCFLVGVEVSEPAAAADYTMIVYDQATSAKTGAQKVTTLCITPQHQSDRIMFPKDREPELVGIYVDWTTPCVGTVYYHL